MTSETPVTLTVHPPQVAGDTVWFTWSDDGGLPAPNEGGLFYRFEQLDLSPISDELWMEVFLALRLGTYARLDRSVKIKLPIAVPAAVVEYWQIYHGADQVQVAPQSTASSYAPLRSGMNSPVLPGYRAAIYFGGGRESLATACLLGEIYGRNQVLLIQCVDPVTGTEQRRQRDASRLDELCLHPAKEVLGFATQRVWSNAHDVAVSEDGKANEPHLQQYTAGMLPALLLHRVELSTPGYPWLEFVIRPAAEGNSFRYPRSRPEMLAAETRHRQIVSGIDHQYVNVAMTFIGNSAFKLLFHRYPDAFPFVLSCVQGSPNERWCHNCIKCSRHAWNCIQQELTPIDFSIDRMMSSSKWVRRFLRGVDGMEAPASGHNSPFTPGWVAPIGFGAMCETLHRANPRFVRSVMSDDAWFNALVMQTHYGNRALPAYGMSPSQSYYWFPPELGAALREIVGQYAPIVDTLQPLIYSDDQVEGPFARPFHHPLMEHHQIQSVAV